ncbi:MAG: S8/S53 family peptidase [Reyranella sp.]|nr:S8/S53 family peptidase [Reyranella sp.]
MQPPRFVVAALPSKPQRPSIFRRTAIAAVLSMVGAGTTVGQSIDILRIRTVGEPPKEVIDFVADNAIRQTVTLAAGVTLRQAIVQRCGYVGNWAPTDYLIKLVEFNRVTMPAAASLDTRLPSPVELDMPACITARTREVDVRDNQGIGQLIKDELGMDYDPAERKWANFITPFCTLNSNASCTNKANPVLQKDKVILPAALTVSEIGVPNSAIQATGLRKVLIDAAKASSNPDSKQFFDWKDVEVVRRPEISPSRTATCIKANTPVALPLGNGIEPVNWTQFLRLAAEYSDHQRKKKEHQPPIVITIVDTGTDDSRQTIKSRLHRPDGWSIDSSQAELPNFPTPYPTGDFRPLDSRLIFNPTVLPPEHGTEVTSIALGETSMAAILPGAASLPRIRFFRALRKSKVGGLYMLDESSFARAFKFIGDRVHQKEAGEMSVVNISLATELANSMEDAVARLVGLRDTTLVVAAAGNEKVTITAPDDPNGGRLVFPAAYGGKNPKTGAFVVSVGASRSSGDGPTDDSNVSEQFVDLFAWGECEEVIGIGGLRAIRAGTSVAAPWVTLTASFLLQGPLLTHPSTVKTRLLSAVRGAPAFREVSESGGLLDPIRTIDVMVDHLIFIDEDKSVKRIRGLVDYKKSSSPCAQVPAIGNLARFEVREDKKIFFRSRNYFLPQKGPRRSDLTRCNKPNLEDDKIIRVYLDSDFEQLADGKSVTPTPIPIARIQEYVARLNEAGDDVTALLRNSDTRCLYLRTAAIANNSTPPTTCLATVQ